MERHGESEYGKTPTKTYQIWKSMRYRCRASKGKDAKSYAVKGILVCERWESYKSFLEDMGHAPSGMSLDRIDNNGPYCKENCRWATQSTQNRNTSRNNVLALNGREMCISDWESELGLKKGAVWHRINSYGWSIERALSTKRGAA